MVHIHLVSQNNNGFVDFFEEGAAVLVFFVYKTEVYKVYYTGGLVLARDLS